MRKNKLERIKNLLNDSIIDVRKELKSEYMIEWNSGFLRGLEHAFFIINLVENKKKPKMIDTGTQYGYINIEKNGKKGVIEIL